MKGSALELAEAEGFGPSPSHFQLSTSNSCSSGLYTADSLAPLHTDPRTAWIYTFSVSLAPGNAQVTPLSDTDCIFCYANDISLFFRYHILISYTCWELPVSSPVARDVFGILVNPSRVG